MKNDELSIDHPPRGIRMEQTLDGGIAIRVRMFGVTSFGVLVPTLFWNGNGKGRLRQGRLMSLIFILCDCIIHSTKVKARQEL